MQPEKYIIVAGHTCMDLFPRFKTGARTLLQVLQPGKLVDVGPLDRAIGGVVPNTGGALARLGLPVYPLGKVGDDDLGKSILTLMRNMGLRIDGMIVDHEAYTSYSIILNIPGIDRIPLHCPGANDIFSANDISDEALAGARHLHFGYPPLMRGMFTDAGEQLSLIFQKAARHGLTTSLDMARPDPDSEAGKVDWRILLDKVLPHVDIFTPSIDELLYMLNRSLFDRFVDSTQPLGGLKHADLEELGAALTAMGTREVLIKLGAEGAFYYSSEKSIYTPCFEVNLAGAIGSGDCTVAGFLAARLRGMTVEDAVTNAAAAGACNVEQIDSLSGIPDWAALQARIGSGWKKRPPLF